MDLVLLKKLKSFFVNIPECEEFNPMFFILKNFIFKLWYMLGPPVVGRPLQSKTNQHFGPIFGIALTCVERNDAPGNEFCPIEIFSFFPQKTRECKSKTKKNTDHGIN